MRSKSLVKLMAARGERHRITLALDIPGEKPADLRIVVGDENALLCGHRGFAKEKDQPRSSAATWLQRDQFCNEIPSFGLPAVFRHKSVHAGNAWTCRDQAR